MAVRGPYLVLVHVPRVCGRGQEGRIKLQSGGFVLCVSHQRQSAHGVAFESRVECSRKLRASVHHCHQSQADSQQELTRNNDGDDASGQRETFHYVVAGSKPCPFPISGWLYI